jgi:hypothetical protein
MMKKYRCSLLPAIVLGACLTLAFTTLTMHLSNSYANFQTAGVYQAATPTPTPQSLSHPGSTDGIMLMGVIIFLIILLPIIFSRSTWTR